MTVSFSVTMTMAAKASLSCQFPLSFIRAHLELGTNEEKNEKPIWTRLKPLHWMMKISRCTEEQNQVVSVWISFVVRCYRTCLPDGWEWWWSHHHCLIRAHVILWWCKCGHERISFSNRMAEWRKHSETLTLSTQTMLIWAERKTTLVNTLYEFKTKVSLIVRAVYVQLATKRKRRRRKAADVLDHDQPSWHQWGVNKAGKLPELHPGLDLHICIFIQVEIECLSWLWNHSLSK